jgi:hypothetical protein
MPMGPPLARPVRPSRASWHSFPKYTDRLNWMSRSRIRNLGAFALISQTAEYALRAIVCLGASPGAAVTTQRIAETTHVPAGYLSQALQALKRAGLVVSHRGIGAGTRSLVRWRRRRFLMGLIPSMRPAEGAGRRGHCYSSTSIAQARRTSVGFGFRIVAGTACMSVGAFRDPVTSGGNVMVTQPFGPLIRLG